MHHPPLNPDPTFLHQTVKYTFIERTCRSDSTFTHQIVTYMSQVFFFFLNLLQFMCRFWCSWAIFIAIWRRNWASLMSSPKHRKNKSRRNKTNIILFCIVTLKIFLHTCLSSNGIILLLLLLDSSGLWSSCLLSIANGCWGGVLPRANGPPSAPGPRLGWGIPTGIGGAPWAPGICWACICCNNRGKSGRCCC